MCPSRRIWLVLLSLVPLVQCAAGAIPDVIRLWPGVAPGSGNLTFTERITERSTNPRKQDRAATQIVEPTLTAFRPTRPNGAVVIVAPGGGWQRVAIDKEGADPAAWLNRHGITAFVLKYRLATEGHENAHNVALQDAQRAMRLVRRNAKAWGLDAGRIGLMGYSAGGHLVASVAFYADKRVYLPVDEIDALLAKPDFVIIGYAPARELPKLSDAPRSRMLRDYRIEAAPGAKYPPAFIFHADDDRVVPSDHAAQIYLELKKSGTPAELHIFRAGGHGFGMREATGPIAKWPDLCAEWLQGIGVLR